MSTGGGSPSTFRKPQPLAHQHLQPPMAERRLPRLLKESCLERVVHQVEYGQVSGNGQPFGPDRASTWAHATVVALTNRSAVRWIRARAPVSGAEPQPTGPGMNAARSVTSA